MSKVYILTHLGLGDMVTTIGMIRYLTTIHDEVMIATKHKKELEYIYSNEPKVTLRQVEDDRQARQVPLGYTLISSGIHKGNYNNDVPFLFYRDSGVPEEYFWTYFSIPDSSESKELYESVKDKDYIVVHNNTSRGQLFSVKSAKEHYSESSSKEVILIDLNDGEFAMRPLIHYKDLLINASALYLSNSCIFCLALNLELECEKCYYVSRYNMNYEYLYKNVNNVKRKRFIQITLK